MFLGNQQFNSYIKLQCIPLMTALYAVGNPVVNLLVLDIEGGEFEVTCAFLINPHSPIV